MRTVALKWQAALLLATSATAAQACSVTSSYRVPTNLQLVEQADVIVLARVTDGGPSSFGEVRKAKLIPFAVLKGAVLPGPILLEDAFLSSEQMKATASDPRNLVDANPEAFSGSCNRSTFANGMIVLSFLRRTTRGFDPIVPAFSRALEDVPSPDALWVKTVRLYVKIADVPKLGRLKEMRYWRDLLKVEIDDPDSRLLALELDRAIRQP